MTPRNVELVVKGAVGDLLEAELPDAVVTMTASVTSARLVVRDASALYALLDRLETLGVELLAVHGMDRPPSDDAVS